MAPKKQAGKTLKKRLIDLDLTVSGIARGLGRPRPSVSAALHQGKFPLLRQKIREAFDV